MRKQDQNISLIIQVCIWVTVILWSSALVAIRIGLQGYTPGALAVFRYLVASLCLIILYFKLPNKQVPKFRDLLSILLIGLVGIGVYNIAINYGEIVIPAGIAGFIIGLMPVFTMFFAFFLLGERVPIKCWIGVLISLVGLFLIAYHEKAEMKYYIGLAYVLLAAVLGGYYAVAQKKLFHRYQPLELVIFSIWGATLGMMIFVPSMIRELPKAPWQATAAAVYLGIFPAATAYAFWNFALSKSPAGRASGYLYAMPIIATFLGMILLREYPQPIELTGGLITLAGAFIINYFYKLSSH